MRYRNVGVMLYVVATAASAVAGDTTFEGTISATSTRAGMDRVHFLFTRKGSQVRIENTSNKLEPINLIDLDAKRLTIVYPHNTTFVTVDLRKRQQHANGPGLPPVMQLTAGYPSPVSVG